MSVLHDIAQQMVVSPKGILAIDESSPTCQKRFEGVGVECNEENRRQYRQLLVTAPEVEKYLSGMIFFDETLRQKTDDGIPFPKALSDKGILPGIKTDMGAKDLALHLGEKVTEGLDGLRERLAEYSTLGAKFTKWRAVITIGDGIPTEACMYANAHALARNAALSQEAGMVPMVEPEVLLNGNHTIEKCYEVSSRALEILFEELNRQNVDVEGTILKTSMVLSGKDCADQADLDTVAEMTVDCFKKSVPAELPGIVFLSGGQSGADSTLRLNAMNALYKDMPWKLSFSYGRGIQVPALNKWAEDIADPKNITEAQKILAHRSKMNSVATIGEYNEDLEN